MRRAGGRDRPLYFPALPRARLRPSAQRRSGPAVESIVEGRQPTTLTAEALTRRIELPLSWCSQRTALNLEEPETFVPAPLILRSRDDASEGDAQAKRFPPI